jgi:hypothetical protein
MKLVGQREERAHLILDCYMLFELYAIKISWYF